jgi:hypothetical membrane protein
MTFVNVRRARDLVYLRKNEASPMNTVTRKLLENPHKTSGLLMFVTGVVIFMGIITAEIFYPPGYSTAQNEISDLGATVPPNSIIVQPSATIFDTTMMLSGIMVIVAAYFIHRAYQQRLVTGSILLLGIGLLGVGIFPGNVAGIHGLFALLTFVAAGTSAIVSSSVTSAPFRHVAILLGGITLVFLLLAFFFGSVVFPILGDGGTERWVAYPSVLWITGFGGYLLAYKDSRLAEFEL